MGRPKASTPICQPFLFWGQALLPLGCCWDGWGHHFCQGFEKNAAEVGLSESSRNYLPNLGAFTGTWLKSRDGFWSQNEYLLFWLREPNPLSEYGWERLMKLEAWPCWTCREASPSAPPPLCMPPLKMATNVNVTSFQHFCLCPQPHISHYMLKLPRMIPTLCSEVIRGPEKGETGGGFMFEMSINNWFGEDLDSEHSGKNPHFDMQVARGKFARNGDRSWD